MNASRIGGAVPPFLVGSAAAVAGEVAAGLLLYSGAGFLQALTLVLATLLGALALGLWSAPTPPPEAPVEAARRRWLLTLVAFAVAGVTSGAWSLLGGLTSGAVARGLGLALLAALPLYAAGGLLGTMAALRPHGIRGPGAAAAAGAAVGAVFTGFLLVRTVAPLAMYVYCLLALSAGALLHGGVLDRYLADHEGEGDPAEWMDGGPGPAAEDVEDGDGSVVEDGRVQPGDAPAVSGPRGGSGDTEREVEPKGEGAG